MNDFLIAEPISDQRYVEAIENRTRTLEDQGVLVVRAIQRRIDLLRSAEYLEEADWLFNLAFVEGAECVPPWREKPG